MMSWTCSLAFRSIPCSSCKHAVRPIRRMHCHALSTSGARFVRKHIARLAPYKPIVPFEILSGIIAWPSPRGCSTSICFNLYRALSSTEELGIAPEDIVKLDANENPYGPPPGFFFPQSMLCHLTSPYINRSRNGHVESSIPSCVPRP